ncbi:hypothetical protein ACFSM5_05040 [Lacibacterium aquatile]|uniref:DUF4131 domain-containing protein n=1 Tax=Lacibacterium aquatile TaxID=1168082 RepID=A0ABW5DM73_9PROT
MAAMQTLKRRIPPKMRPFAAAGILAFGYLIALHPVSGPLGGIPFFFLGWLVPTFLQFTLAFGIAGLVPGKPLGKALVFCVALITLVMLPNAGRLIDWMRYDPATEIQLTGQGQGIPNVPYNPHTSLILSDSPWLSRWTIGWNEACFCLYFEPSDSSNYLDRLDLLLLRMGLRDKFGSTPFRKHLPQGYQLTEHIEADGEAHVTLVLAVYQGKQLRGIFRHRHLPKSLLGHRQSSLSWRNLNEDFLNRAGDMLLRASLMNKIISLYLGPSFFPEAELIEFIRATMPIQPSPS